jgi:hypothetical protein
MLRNGDRYIIILLGSLLAMFVPYVHMKGRVSASPAGWPIPADTLFFVWTLLAIGVLEDSSPAILAARGLWSPPWRRPR